MKNIMKITFAAIIVLILPFSILCAQEKKTEKKIKIITNDGSGERVIIDTVFAGNGPDSLKLKNGTVVYLKHDGDDMHNEGDHHVMIATISNDGDDEGKVIKEITIVRNDSSDSHNGDKGDIMIYNNSSPDASGNVHYKVIKKSDGQGDDQVYYINKSVSHDKSDADDDTFNVFVSTDDHDSGIDKSRYVIAKDGMVVTVEGTDEAKTQALAKEIEEKLGVNNKSDKKEEKSKTDKKTTK